MRSPRNGGPRVELIKFLESIITGIVSRVVAEELKAWSPTIVTKFTAIAVGRLPVEQRERFAEEWESHLNAIPGDLSKIVFAFDLIRAARRFPSNPKTDTVQS